MKNRFKITPEVRLQLDTWIKILPECHRKNGKGELMYRKVTRLIDGKHMHVKEAILVDHLVNLNKVFQIDGQPGVDTYVEFFMGLAEKQNQESNLKIA